MTPNTLLGALAYAVIGLTVFVAAFRLVVFTLPGDPWRKAVQEQSLPAAVVLGAIALALGWIVASAVH